MLKRFSLSLPWVMVLTVPITSSGQEVPRPGSRVRLTTTAPPITKEGTEHTLHARLIQEGEHWMTFAPNDGESMTLAKEGKRLAGKLVRLDENYLTLRVSGASQDIRVPRTSVRRLEVSRGRSMGKGALIGAVTGTAPGLLTVLLAPDREGFITGRDLGKAGAFVGGIVGALVGLVVGGPERWQDVDKKRWRVAVAPTRGGASAQVAINFK